MRGKLVQPENAQQEIVRVDDGKVISDNDEQSSNNPRGMYSIPSFSTTSLRLMHFLKTYLPILSTVDGTLMLSNDVQLSNTCIPTD